MLQCTCVCLLSAFRCVDIKPADSNQWTWMPGTSENHVSVYSSSLHCCNPVPLCVVATRMTITLFRPFLSHPLQLFSVLCCLCLPVLLPLNATGGGVQIGVISGEQSKLTTSNIGQGSPKLWGHFIVSHHQKLTSPCSKRRFCSHCSSVSGAVPGDRHHSVPHLPRLP